MRNRVSTPLLLIMLVTLTVLWLAPNSSIHRDRNKPIEASTSGENLASSPRPGASPVQNEIDKKDAHPEPTKQAAATRSEVAHALQTPGRTSSESPALESEPSAHRSTLEALLERAASKAETERNLIIDPGVIATALVKGEARIIFEDADGSSTAKLAALNTIDLRDFPLLATGAATVSAASLAAFIEEAGTTRIELDRVHRPTLADSVPLIGAGTLHANDQDGDGFAVAILDTGIDSAHPVFAGRIIEEACFSVEDDCPNGDRSMMGAGAAAPCPLGGCGHGTHVAGIAIGNDPEGSLTGVAPHASIIAIQIFSDVDGEPGAYSSDILSGMQHVLALADFYAIASVNLSFGSGEYTSHCDSSAAMYNAVQRLREVGIATVAASGNDAWTNAVSSPACLSNVISVGSINDDDVVSSFSNTSETLTLLAPGRSIRSAAVGGGSYFSSGTSMAAPHVSGAIASLREAYPAATVGEMENALSLSGLPVLDDRTGFTFPRIRADQAQGVLESAATESPEADPPAPAPAEGEEGAVAAASPKSGGGGGSCGLLGIEPFLILGAIRAARRIKRRAGQNWRAGRKRRA